MATRVSQALPRDLRFEPTPKRVRAQLAGETVADSRGAILVWEPRRAVPVYAFPAADVRADALRDSGDPIPGAHGGGATFWDVHSGGEVAGNAAWRYADPDLAGHVALSWEAFDRWIEEDEEVFGHPRDRGTASTGAAARATSGSRSTARSSPTAGARRSSSRRACRRGTTCRARTSRWTACAPAPR